MSIELNAKRFVSWLLSQDQDIEYFEGYEWDCSCPLAEYLRQHYPHHISVQRDEVVVNQEIKVPLSPDFATFVDRVDYNAGDLDDGMTSLSYESAIEIAKRTWPKEFGEE